LQYEHVLATHVIQQLHHHFAVGKATHIGTTQRNMEMLGDRFSELRIGIAGKYHQAVVGHVYSLFLNHCGHTPKSFGLCHALKKSSDRYCVLAEEVGIEPTNDGIKTRCLTTWRLPNSHPMLQRMCY
jgi:hypothetical protein